MPRDDVNEGDGSDNRNHEGADECDPAPPWQATECVRSWRRRGRPGVLRCTRGCARLPSDWRERCSAITAETLVIRALMAVRTGHHPTAPSTCSSSSGKPFLMQHRFRRHGVSGQGTFDLRPVADGRCRFNLPPTPVSGLARPHTPSLEQGHVAEVSKRGAWRTRARE